VTGPKFFAEALAEYEDAVVYYEKREEGLGARLIQEFNEAVALALEYPGAFPRAGYKSSPQEEPLAHLSSSDTPVVVMEPAEHRDCVDAAIRLEWTWNRLLVPEGLVRTRFVVVADVLGDDAPEVILTEDEDVVEHLSPEYADEALSKGIHVRRAYRRAHDAHARRPEYGSEAKAELRVVVADDNLWYAVHGGVPGLLRAPLVGRRIGHRGMEDRSATQVQEEEYEHLAEPHVERLHEVTRPRHVVSQERRPALPVASGSRAAHVPLNRSLAHADA
jgi:hypothetical protein